MWIKFLISIFLFCQVLIFALLPYYSSKVATSKTIMNLFNGFSTGLFLGISFLHMIPEANEKLQKHSHGKSVHIPLGSLISVVTFLFIYTLEVYFHGQHKHHQLPYQNAGQQQSKADNKLYMQTILTQAALSLHCFFECLSIGIQKNYKLVLTLSMAICIHKWAEALTLGYSYYSAKMSLRTAVKFAIFHSLLNSSAVLIGWWASAESRYLGGILNGIAGGTFLYVCFIQKISHHLTRKQNIISQMSCVLLGLALACVL